MTSLRPSHVVPRTIQPGVSRNYVQLPPSSIYLDDILDVVEILRRQGPEMSIEVDAFGVRWDDVDAAIDRAGKRTVHELRIHAWGKDDLGDALESEVDLGRSYAQLSWVGAKSRPALDEVAHTIMRRARSRPHAFWNIVSQHSTIRFSRWGDHQGFLERNRDLLVGLIGALAGAVALAIAERIAGGK